MYAGCWTFQAVSTSPASRSCVGTETQSRRQSWCQGVPTQWSPSSFTTTHSVCFLPLSWLADNLPLPTRLGMLTTPPPIDLSRATRLRTVDLRSDTQAVEWITRTLQTIKSQYLTEIAIFVPPFLTGPVQTVHREWEDLDHVLVQFLTSRSIRPVFKYKATPGSDGTGKRLRALLPELASRGVVDVAEIEG